MKCDGQPSEALKMSKKAAFILTNGLWRPNIDVTDRKDDDDHGLLTPTHFFLSSVSVSFLSVTFILLRHKLPVRPGQPSSSALTDNISRQEAAAKTGVRHYVNTQGFHFTSDIKSVRFNKSLDIDTDFSRLTVNFPGSPGSSLTMLWCGGTAGERTALTSACRHCQHSTEPGLAMVMVTSGGLTPHHQPPGPGSNSEHSSHFTYSHSTYNKAICLAQNCLYGK